MILISHHEHWQMSWNSKIHPKLNLKWEFMMLGGPRKHTLNTQTVCGLLGYFRHVTATYWFPLALPGGSRNSAAYRTHCWGQQRHALLIMTSSQLVFLFSFIAHSLSSVCKEMQSHHSFFSNTIFLHCSMPLVQESSSTHLKKLPPYPRSALSISISWRGMKGFLKREALETQLGKSNWRAESSGIPMTYLKN